MVARVTGLLAELVGLVVVAVVMVVVVVVMVVAMAASLAAVVVVAAAVMGVRVVHEHTPPSPSRWQRRLCSRFRVCTQSETKANAR